MKKRIYILVLFFTLISCSEPPLQFSQGALSEKVVSLDGREITFSQVLETYQGETIFIDVWASWCRDCIEGFPRVKEIQSQYKDVVYLFLSVDRNEVVWKNSLKRFKLEGEHYFLPKGQNGAFGDFLNSNWIPRYMVINKDGSIKLYKAKKATDERLVEALK